MANSTAHERFQPLDSDQDKSPPFPAHLGKGGTFDELAAIAIRKVMTFDEMNQEVIEIFSTAQRRHDIGDRSMLDGMTATADCGTIMNLLNWMTEAERIRKHQLQLAMPTPYEKMTEASARIAKRVADRRSKRQ
ncbi:hypothetical protein RYA05_03140 [Pseudomonas syringae pv. actinidiae]|nr:hypothetical protein [Pseudomonas syringae pv. actinidiae]